MENRIRQFIRKHHVLTLATSSNGKPWCCNCFYAFMEEEMAFVFTSDEGTRHIQEAIKNPFVSGSVVLETRIIGKIQGIQFEGILEDSLTDGPSTYREAYLKRFPFAILMNTRLWILRPETIKFTDNRLGFGKKLIWKRSKNGGIEK